MTWLSLGQRMVHVDLVPNQGLQRASPLSFSLNWVCVASQPVAHIPSSREMPNASRVQATLSELVDSQRGRHPAFAEWIESNVSKCFAVFALCER